MGGDGSGRWNWGGGRETTDGLLRLDVRALARAGALQPGTRSSWEWTDTGQPTGGIALHAQTHAITLHYHTRGPSDAGWIPVSESISVERTSCTYGGVRPWFVCPGCGSRRAILFSVGGMFRCRMCHDLAYASTREDVADRAHRRAQDLRARLGADPESLMVPIRPKGMHERTYARIAHKITAGHRVLLDRLDAEVAAFSRRSGIPVSEILDDPR